MILTNDRAEDRFVITHVGDAGKGLEMDGDGAARILLDDFHRVRAAEHGVAIVKLHNNGSFGVAKEGVPRRLTFERGKFDVMIVIAGDHAVGRQLIGQFIEKGSQLEPVGACFAQISGDARDDQLVVAEDLVKLNRFR